MELDFIPNYLNEKQDLTNWSSKSSSILFYLDFWQALRYSLTQVEALGAKISSLFLIFKHQL